MVANRRSGFLLRRNHHRCLFTTGIRPEDIDVLNTTMPSPSWPLCHGGNGFAEPGKGPALAKEGEISLHGKTRCNRGGLKARGHPVGATGMYQIAEVVQQLRGEAGETQVTDPEFGMAQNIGAAGQISSPIS